MKKITVDLTILSDNALTFEQYLVLYHLHTGEFEKTENQWLVFDLKAFEERFMALKKPGVLPVLLSLKHRKFIDFRSDCSFRIVNKNLFKRKNLERRPAADILSFREEIKVPVLPDKKASILNRSSNLSKWTSPEFKKAAADFEQMRRDKGVPLNQKAADRLAPRLVRLSGDSERIATLILNQSTENSWTGIFELKEKTPVQDRKKNIATWYPETLKPA